MLKNKIILSMKYFFFIYIDIIISCALSADSTWSAFKTISNWATRSTLLSTRIWILKIFTVLYTILSIWGLICSSIIHIAITHTFESSKINSFITIISPAIINACNSITFHIAWWALSAGWSCCASDASLMQSIAKFALISI